MVVLFILAVILISLYEGIPLIQKKLWLELGTLGVLIGSSAFLGIAEILGISTPLNWLEQLLGPIGKMIFR